MKKLFLSTSPVTSLVIGMICMSVILLFAMCTSQPSTQQSAMAETPKVNFGGFESQEKWGEHLVTICGCHDCHTPKMMTEHGPVFNLDLALSGYPSSMPVPDVDRKDLESKGLTVTSDLTVWVGPWGITYAANLTSDPTGTGNWQEANFIKAIREGKLKGLDGSRPIMPPMPWEVYKNMTDDELKAIFAYLKTTKPIKNVVPDPTPPALAAR